MKLKHEKSEGKRPNFTNFQVQNTKFEKVFQDLQETYQSDIFSKIYWI